LLSNGKKVGFFKPIIASSKNLPMEETDSDATFIKDLFALEEPVDLLCPVFSDESSLKSRLKEAYAKVCQGKDVVIIEGISDQSQASRAVVETLDARVVIVESYSEELLKAIDSYKDFGKYLVGIVLNKVPRSRAEKVRGEMFARSDEARINILGVLPDDRALFAPTVGELTEHIHGEMLSGVEQSADLVEDLMLGAMCVDPGPEYFGRKANKGVVIRSERPDMQLAALETSTRCLVVSGDTAPNQAVLVRAEEKNVPVILARDDITTIVTNIEDALGKARFNQKSKLPKLAEVMEQHFDFPTVYKELGFAS